MVCSDSLKGDNIFDKCFANWYAAVFKFDTIGLIGSDLCYHFWELYGF